jgi:solute:Na+ symporter, SSS family
VNSSFVALAFIAVIVFVGAFIGFCAGTRRKMDLEQWTVGDRGFGMLLMWLLMAGEVYTTFTFLGASGWAYSKGAPVLYVLGYQPLMYVVSFFILPQVWEVGRKYRLQTQADFFHVRYNNKYLAAFVALVGIVFIIPYLQLQLMGLGMIVEVASYGAIQRTPAMIISFVIVAAFVLTSGIRGVAWVSVLKDLLLLFSAVFVGVAIPYIYFGGIGWMFAELARAKPAHLVMPGATTNLGHSWYISTVVLVAVGFYMWPQFFGASFSAKSSDTLRRNAVVMPFYSVTMPLMFFIGLAATLVVPGLTNGDLFDVNHGAKDFPGLVPRLDWRGRRSHGNGSRRGHDSYRGNAVRKKYVPSYSLARHDRPTGYEIGQNYGVGDYRRGAMLRDLQFANSRRASPGGIWRRSTVLSWGGVGAVLKARDHAGRVRGSCDWRARLCCSCA